MKTAIPYQRRQKAGAIKMMKPYGQRQAGAFLPVAKQFSEMFSNW
jgi:hypothetical protein